MTINNFELFSDGFWDWAILDGCFGATKIKPMDIDGFVERNGHLLFIETKKPNVIVPIGQSISYSALALHGDVLIVWGAKNIPIKIQHLHGPIIKKYDPASIDTLRDIIGRWYSWANKG